MNDTIILRVVIILMASESAEKKKKKKKEEEKPRAFKVLTFYIMYFSLKLKLGIPGLLAEYIN